MQSGGTAAQLLEQLMHGKGLAGCLVESGRLQAGWLLNHLVYCKWDGLEL